MAAAPPSKTDPGDRARALKEMLRLLPLFKDLESYDPIDFELDLCFGVAQLPEGAPKRPSGVRTESVPAGAAFLFQRSLSTEVFVLLDGEAGAYFAEPGGGSELVESYKAGDWFGESSALSSTPALATVRADRPCSALVLDARFFKKLWREDETFRNRVEERYRERSLILHLKASPLFSGLSRQELLSLRTQAKLETFAEDGDEKKGGVVIASEGDDATDFFLVRSGGVKCAKKDPFGRERVLFFAMANSSFGEEVLSSTDRTWPGTIETLTRTDVVRIPRAAFETLRASRPKLVEALSRRAEQLLAGGLSSGSRGRLAEDELDVMVFGQSVKGGEALVIDKRKCVRCNACVEACVSVHDDGLPRISKVGTRVETDMTLITACYHCAVPDCMASCNYGAIRRDTEGTVVFVYDNCVGCAACVEGCPYDVIRLVPPLCGPAPAAKGTPEKTKTAFAWLKRLFLGPSVVPLGPQAPFTGKELKVVNLGGEEVGVNAKAIKCDLCAGLPFEACVYNCPTFAISRRRPEELFLR